MRAVAVKQVARKPTMHFLLRPFLRNVQVKLQCWWHLRATWHHLGGNNGALGAHLGWENCQVKLCCKRLCLKTAAMDWNWRVAVSSVLGSFDTPRIYFGKWGREGEEKLLWKCRSVVGIAPSRDFQQSSFGLKALFCQYTQVRRSWDHSPASQCATLIQRSQWTLVRQLLRAFLQKTIGLRMKLAPNQCNWVTRKEQLSWQKMRSIHRKRVKTHVLISGLVTRILAPNGISSILIVFLPEIQEE